MLVKILRPDFSFINEEGSLIQLVHDGWKQVNVITSKKGSVRGGHYHKENDEAFYIISGRLKLSISCDGAHETNEFQAGDMFLIGCYQLHDFEFLEDTVMVSMYSNGVEKPDGTKDIYSE